MVRVIKGHKKTTSQYLDFSHISRLDEVRLTGVKGALTSLLLNFSQLIDLKNG